jgi:ferredoxin-NADP reductase
VPADTTTCVVERLRRLSPLVHELDLTSPRPLSWLPGQWASLHLPVGPHPPLVRAYSLAEPPDGTARLPLVFDVVDDGLGSSWLAGLEPGDVVEVAAVMG